MLDLKVEDFKPEFAGKMNFYLSAVDDQLRHADDGPSIGIILCKGRSEIAVEYALRDTIKPMGVAQYRLSAALPEQFRRDLPTAEELAREFPLMSLIELRNEVEQALREFPALGGFASKKPVNIGQVLREFQLRGIAPPSTGPFLDALQAMNDTAGGFDVDPAAAQHVVTTGAEFLEDLRTQSE